MSQPGRRGARSSRSPCRRSAIRRRPGSPLGPHSVALVFGLELRQQRPGRVDRPAAEAVGARGDSEVREAVPPLHTSQQERLAVDLGNACVEDRVGRVRKVGRRQDRIGGVPPEELVTGHRSTTRRGRIGFPTRP